MKVQSGGFQKSWKNCLLDKSSPSPHLTPTFFPEINFVEPFAAVSFRWDEGQTGGFEAGVRVWPMEPLPPLHSTRQRMSSPLSSLPLLLLSPLSNCHCHRCGLRHQIVKSNPIQSHHPMETRYVLSHTSPQHLMAVDKMYSVEFKDINHNHNRSW